MMALPSRRKRKALQRSTNADNCKDLLDHPLHGLFISLRFIGEESYAGGERPDLTDEPTWIVDPIDGTT